MITIVCPFLCGGSQLTKTAASNTYFPHQDIMITLMTVGEWHVGFSCECSFSSRSHHGSSGPAGIQPVSIICSLSSTFGVIETMIWLQSLCWPLLNPVSDTGKEVEAFGESAPVFGRHLSFVGRGKIFKTLHDLCGWNRQCMESSLLPASKIMLLLMHTHYTYSLQVYKSWHYSLFWKVPQCHPHGRGCWKCQQYTG